MNVEMQRQLGMYDRLVVRWVYIIKRTRQMQEAGIILSRGPDTY